MIASDKLEMAGSAVLVIIEFNYKLCGCITSIKIKSIMLQTIKNEGRFGFTCRWLVGKCNF